MLDDLTQAALAAGASHLTSDAMSKVDEDTRRAMIVQRPKREIENRLGDPFRFEPVPLTVFVQDREFLGNPRLSNVQFEAVRHAEQIYYPETLTQLYTHLGETTHGVEFAPLRYVNFITLQWGKGSGKDHVCRIMLARWMYLLLCLKSPQDYFEMPPQDSIHFLNVASSAPQASRVFFTPFRELIRASPFFRRYAEPFEYSIKCENHVEAVSGHSDAETQEGLNILGGIADEISAFKTADEIQNTGRHQGGREPTKTAEGIVKMMRTSARTRFGVNMKIVRISYPRFKGDAIQQATAYARRDIDEKGDRSRHYVDGPRATWDVNPRVKDRTDFEEDYAEDPAMAKAMYECDPGLATNRFFRNAQALSAAFDTQRVPEPVAVSYHWGSTEVEPGQYELAWNPDYTFAPDFQPVEGAIYTIHGDMAQNGDRAGVAMSHVRTWSEVERERWDGEMTSERLPVVKLDFVFVYESDVAAEPQPREIQVRWLRQLVFRLREQGFYIGLVTMDGWQSLDSLQILAARGVASDRVSLDRNDSPWMNFRDLLNDGRYEGYYHELLMLELEAVRRLPNAKVDHPSGGSKDCADAVVGAAIGSLTVGGREAVDAEGEPMEMRYRPGIAQDDTAPRNNPMALPRTNLGLGDSDAFSPLNL